jgi:predicted dienelactone hydrolase
MKYFDRFRPAFSPDTELLSSVNPALRIAATVGLAFAALLLASTRLAAQETASQSATSAVDALPEPTTEVAVASFVTHDFDWYDTTRMRAVPVRLYLPALATRSQPLPLVVFSHGIGGSRQGYSYLGSYWATRGYASLHLQHVGSDRSLWTGNIFNLVGRLQGAAQEDEAIARVGDLRFALDQMLADGQHGPMIDDERIIAAGHSYGANTVMLAIGARIERSDRVIELADPRLKAAVLLSAPPFYGETNTARILGDVKIPTLHITATEDTIRIPGYYSGVADRFAVFDAMTGAHKVLAVFDGGSHGIFTDRSGTGGATLNPLVKTATKELSLAFFDSVLGRGDAALRNWHARHTEIVAHFVSSEL